MWAPKEEVKTRPVPSPAARRAPPPPPMDPATLAAYPADLRRAPNEQEIAAARKLGEQVLLYVAQAEGACIPKFPSLAAEVFALTEKPELDVSKVVAALKKESTLCAEVLRVANAAFFSGISPIENIREAVVRLGGKSTAQAVAAAATKDMFPGGGTEGLTAFAPLWQRLWKHGFTTAVGSAYLSMQLRKGDMDRAFLGGLLHDVGKGIALQALTEMLQSKKITENITADEALVMIEEIHPKLGERAAEHWKLPPQLAAFTTSLHAEDIGADLPELCIVRVISGIDEARLNPRHPESVIREITSAVSALGMNPFQIRALATEMAEITKRIETSQS